MRAHSLFPFLRSTVLLEVEENPQIRSFAIIAFRFSDSSFLSYLARQSPLVESRQTLAHVVQEPWHKRVDASEPLRGVGGGFHNPGNGLRADDVPGLVRC